jgi:ABC-type Fe3+/spermidine/putrescine transport system ATPase subunit
VWPGWSLRHPGGRPGASRTQPRPHGAKERPTVEDVTLDVAAGSFFALLGASGSGKTTLLKLIGGYLTPHTGRVVIAGRDVTDLPPERRRVGMVFQSYALFPHLSARGNVAFGLEARGVPAPERRRRVEEMLDRVALPTETRDRKPAGLSGGQQQRVALARALVIEPDLLLLDEPLANLDRRLSEQVRGELRDLQRRTGVTTLLVTHDHEEALALADQVGVMAAGRLLQVGTPREVYERPCCPYVARLLGDANLLPGERPGDILLVRPEGLRLGEEGMSWTGEILNVSYRGSHARAELLVGGRKLVADVPAGFDPTPGRTVGVGVAPGAAFVLPHGDPPGLGA